MTRAIIIPVALKPYGNQLRVHMLEAQHTQWPPSVVEPARSATVETTLQRLENAGVLYEDGEPVLVITTVLPMLTTDNGKSELLVPWADDAASGIEMDPATARSMTEQARRLVIQYWRDQLTRTNAVFEFLPQYFTSYQVRAVYSSLWGKVQSDGNFARWLKDVKGPDGKLIRADLNKDAKKAREQVRNQVRAEFAHRVAELDIANAEVISEAIVKAWPIDDKAPVGVSAAVNSLPELTMAIHPEFADIGAQIGAELAYQDGKKGSPPNWHTRAHPGRVAIEPQYAPRPAQDYPIDPFITPVILRKERK